MDIAFNALLLASAVMPTLVLLGFLYFQDTQLEPTRVIVTTFMLGVVSTVPILGYLALVQPWFDGLVLSPYMAGFGQSFLLAALPEEALKFGILMFYVRHHTAFDEPMDGVVYGAAASLGFATLENLIYVDTGGFHVALARALSAVPCHAALGMIMGCYLAQEHFRPERHDSLMVRALLIPLLLHGLYDFPLLTMQELGPAASRLELLTLTSVVFAGLGLMIGWALWLWYRLRKLQRSVKAAG